MAYVSTDVCIPYGYGCLSIKYVFLFFVFVVQWIERRPPEPKIWVRVPAETPKNNRKKYIRMSKKIEKIYTVLPKYLWTI